MTFSALYLRTERQYIQYGVLFLSLLQKRLETTEQCFLLAIVSSHSYRMPGLHHQISKLLGDNIVDILNVASHQATLLIHKSNRQHVLTLIINYLSI